MNRVVRYTQGDATAGFALTGMCYCGDWDATDQVPRRAIETGVVMRFGTLDSTNGGSTQRLSLG